MFELLVLLPFYILLRFMPPNGAEQCNFKLLGNNSGREAYLFNGKDAVGISRISHGLGLLNWPESVAGIPITKLMGSAKLCSSRLKRGAGSTVVRGPRRWMISCGWSPDWLGTWDISKEDCCIGATVVLSSWEAGKPVPFFVVPLASDHLTIVELLNCEAMWSYVKLCEAMWSWCRFSKDSDCFVLSWGVLVLLSWHRSHIVLIWVELLVHHDITMMITIHDVNVGQWMSVVLFFKCFTARPIWPLASRLIVVRHRWEIVLSTLTERWHGSISCVANRWCSLVCLNHLTIEVSWPSPGRCPCHVFWLALSFIHLIDRGGMTLPYLQGTPDNYLALCWSPIHHSPSAFFERLEWWRSFGEAPSSLAALAALALDIWIEFKHI